MQNESLFVSFILNRELSKHENAIYTNTIHGKASEKVARSLTRLIKTAISQNDVHTLLELERNAIHGDIDSYGALEAVQTHWLAWSKLSAL